MDRLRSALNDLKAVPIAVPPFELEYLERGHAVHFRCGHPECSGLRVDVMSKMRGVDPFSKLWERRTTAIMEDGAEVDVLSLPDLVKAKKTQRDKDWPMITRLVESNYYRNQEVASAGQIAFWLTEGRSTQFLMKLAEEFPTEAATLARSRALLNHAISGEELALESALEAEQKSEREADRAYWRPLKAELETLRRQRLSRKDA